MAKKTKNIRINVVLNEMVMSRVNQFATDHSEDRSTAIRQLILLGFFHKQLDQCAGRYKNGELTLRQVSELLGMSYHETNELMAQKGVYIQDLPENKILERIRAIKKTA